MESKIEVPIKTCGGVDCNEVSPDRSAAGARKDDRGCQLERRNDRAKLRDESLNGEIFYSLREAPVVIDKWRIHYNTERPHASLSYRPPKPLTIAPKPFPLDEGSNIQ